MLSDGLLQRKQKEIQKENEFYVQLLQKALPAEHQTAEKQKGKCVVWNRIITHLQITIYQ